MKNKKKLIYSLLVIIGAIMVVVGFIIAAVLDHTRIGLWGVILICLGGLVLLNFGARLLNVHFADKEKKQKKQENYFKRLDKIDEKRQAFKFNNNYPETNTLKLTGAGMEFYAEGRYVCEKDINHVSGHHFAFEISTTSLKHMPEDYDDVCDLESTGVLISMGNLDSESDESGKVNGVLLSRAPENYGDSVITLDSDIDDCSATVWTAEGDEVDFGFVKILDFYDDVITIYFSLTVSYGLCDTVEGVVELKKVLQNKTSAIQSVINKIKRKRYNTIEVSAEEVKEIEKNNPFLPESYITFLKEVGFADMDWIDLGRNTKTPINLADDETEYIKKLFAEHYGNLSVDDFYFIGIDSDGRYYAFSKNGNGKVYEFSDGEKTTPQYETFEKLLSEIITA